MALSRRAALAAPLAVVALPLPAAALAADDDRELLRLGDRLKAAIALEDQAREESTGLQDDHPLAVRAHDAGAAIADIVNRIITLRAATGEGIRIKALSLRWCCAGMRFDPRDLAGPGGHVTTDVRVLAGLANDLMQLVDRA